MEIQQQMSFPDIPISEGNRETLCSLTSSRNNDFDLGAFPHEFLLLRVQVYGEHADQISNVLIHDGQRDVSVRSGDLGSGDSEGLYGSVLTTIAVSGPCKVSPAYSTSALTLK